MAKKSRPTFSAPSTKGAPTPAAPGWVYRSEPETKARTTARRPPAEIAAPAPVAPPVAARAAAPVPVARVRPVVTPTSTKPTTLTPRSATATPPGVLVSSLAVLMYPCAAVAVFIGSPIGRLWRARRSSAAVTPHGPA